MVIIEISVSTEIINGGDVPKKKLRWEKQNLIQTHGNLMCFKFVFFGFESNQLKSGEREREKENQKQNGQDNPNRLWDDKFGFDIRMEFPLYRSKDLIFFI